MPLAVACVNTGPRCDTHIGSSPENAGNRFGTTRTCQWPSGPYVSSAGGVASSLPGQNGHARAGSASTGRRRGAKSTGRSDRSAAIVTHRPVSGLSRSWLNGWLRHARHATYRRLATSPRHLVHRNVHVVVRRERCPSPVAPALDQATAPQPTPMRSSSSGAT